jgi:hypothetical protein
MREPASSTKTEGLGGGRSLTKRCLFRRLGLRSRLNVSGLNDVATTEDDLRKIEHSALA